MVLQQSAQKLQEDTGLPAEATFVADITVEGSHDLTRALQGAHALVIATSAVPKQVCNRTNAQLHRLMPSCQCNNHAITSAHACNII